MNFSPFGGHFPATIPSIHQFAAKFTHDGTSSLMTQDGTNRYHTANMAHFNQHHTPLGVPVNMGKFRQTETGTIVTSNNTNTSQHNMMNNVTSKYHTSASNISHQYTPSANLAVPYSQPNNIQQNTQMHVQNRTEDKTRNAQINNSNYHNQSTQNGNEIAQDLCAIMQASGQLPETSKDRRNDKSVKQEREQHEERPTSGENEYNNAMHQQSIHHHNQSTAMPATWQSLAAPGSTVADYLSHLPASTLPLSLHHFLKYSAESIKKESLNNQQNDLVGVVSQSSNLNLVGNGTSNMNLVVNTSNNATTTDNTPAKKKKKKKAPKEKKPRPKPGEIRLTTALDGSTLYCCPECQMAYPEKELLEQHLVGHTLERRFVCDICNAALKRKDHLTRHKQSHNPERPYVCTVCLKAFKRKEQLTLHFVIHSGEKRHICPECGKGFYRKDHLRKHTRSHIARRVKAELSQQSGPTSGTGSTTTPQPGNNHQNNPTSVSNQTSMITAHVLQGAQVATPAPLPQPPGQSLLS